MSRKPKNELIPTWILSEDWGLSTDAYCWIVMGRSYNKKTGEPSGWKNMYYYGSAGQALKGLFHRLTRDEIPEEHESLMEFLERNAEMAQALEERLIQQFKKDGMYDIPKPEKWRNETKN